MESKTKSDGESYANEFITKLKNIFPAWKAATDGDTQTYLRGYAREMIIAFGQNSINTGEQVNLMLANARKCEKPFLPSVGQLVTWASPEIKAPVIAMHQEFDDADTKLIAQQASSPEKAKSEFARIRRLMSAPSRVGFWQMSVWVMFAAVWSDAVERERQLENEALAELKL